MYYLYTVKTQTENVSETIRSDCRVHNFRISNALPQLTIYISVDLVLVVS